MNCMEARSTMLRCDLTDLAPAATGELAGHIRGCADCRGLADAIIAGTGMLRSALLIRSQSHSDRAFPRRRMIGALAIAVGLIVGIAVAHRSPHTRAAIEPQQTGPITIENAQGRAVTVVERPDTINIIFHALEPE